MSAQALAVARTGLVTAVGLSSPAACAAIRAGLTNPSQSRYAVDGEWIMGHAVPLGTAVRGRARLAQMAAMAMGECLSDVPRPDWSRIALLLCVAERTRPGRFEGLEDDLARESCGLLDDAAFSPQSAVIPQGRVSIAVALLQARKFLYESDGLGALIVATDSLLTWPTLQTFDERQRLLGSNTSNGFLPGEAASAVLVTRPSAPPYLNIDGLGFATEHAVIEREEPLRADGLTRAIGAALRDAGCEMHDMDCRIADVSGEQYYFKEAALAVSRTLRRRKPEFDLWHPAECIGEVGSAIGPAMLAVAEASCRKRYAPGPSLLIHAANDAGQRAAIVARYVGH